MKRQFKVRLVEKPLSINTEQEVVATTGTATETSMVKPTATAAKLNQIPLTVYNLSRPGVQEIPKPTIKKSQEREGPFTPNHGKQEIIRRIVWMGTTMPHLCAVCPKPENKRFQGSRLE